MPFPTRSSLRIAMIPLLCCVALLVACGAGSSGANARSAPSQAAPFAAPSNSQVGRASRAITYVALGASDAFGVGTDDPDRQNWPNDLAGELGPNVHLINLGIPGATLAQAMRDEMPVALDAHPDVVTIWLAVNDFAAGLDAAAYGQQLSSLLASLRQNTRARVFVANLPDLSLLPYFSAQDPVALRARIQVWNAVISATCAEAGAHLVNLAADWSDLADHPEYISGDGLHPSTAGAQALADAFASAIHQAGGA